MKAGIHPPARSPAKRGIRFFLAFSGIIAVFVIVLGINYAGKAELSSLTDRQQAFFERNIYEQSTSLSRVIFAVSDFLRHEAESRDRPDPRRLLELGQAVANHAIIPETVDPASLEKLLGDDPLFLAERLSASNAEYRATIAELSRLLGEARGSGNDNGGPAPFAAITGKISDFHEELHGRSQLFLQIEGVYHVANRSSLERLHRQDHIGLAEFVILTAMLSATAALYLRSRLAIERELEIHRSHLEELVDLRTVELEEANARLGSALGERETLIKEVYHRTKNNLALIASIISLQRGESEAADIDKAFEGLENRVGAIAMMHEKLYRSDNLTSVSFRDYIGDLCRSIVDTLANPPGSVSLGIDACDAEFPAKTLLNLGLIVNELVTNSFKHGFKAGRRGHIRVSLAGGPDGYILRVQNDGIQAANTEAILGGSSMGSTIVRNLVEQMMGSLSVDLSEGTAIVVSFPAGQ